MPATRGRRAAAAPAPAPTPAPPPTNPLEEYRLAFSGKFPGYSHKELHSLFTSLGASVTPSVNGRNTHLVCDEKDYLKAAPKVRDAQAAGVSLIKPEWVNEVAKLQTNVDPNNYLWVEEESEDEDQKPAPNGNANGTANGNTKKRPIAVANPNGSTGDADDKPKAKKPKGKAAKVKDEDDVEEDDKEDAIKEETIETKLKELSKGQFLKKKDVMIPMDEHCPLQSYTVYIEKNSGMIYDAALNQSSTSNNHNKFYRLQVGQLPQNCSLESRKSRLT